MCTDGVICCIIFFSNKQYADDDLLVIVCFLSRPIMVIHIARQAFSRLRPISKELVPKRDLVGLRVVHPYNDTRIITPPRTPISPVERSLWYFVTLLTVISVPAWVMYHARKYRGQTYQDWIKYQNRWCRAG